MGALSDYKKAININQYFRFYQNLGLTKDKINDLEAAFNYWLHALRLGLPYRKWVENKYE